MAAALVVTVFQIAASRGKVMWQTRQDTFAIKSRWLRRCSPTTGFAVE
jgi:hypothetical protein